MQRLTLLLYSRPLLFLSFSSSSFFFLHQSATSARCFPSSNGKDRSYLAVNCFEDVTSYEETYTIEVKEYPTSDCNDDEGVVIPTQGSKACVRLKGGIGSNTAISFKCNSDFDSDSDSKSRGCYGAQPPTPAYDIAGYLVGLIVLKWLRDLMILRSLLDTTTVEFASTVSIVPTEWSEPWACYLNNQAEADSAIDLLRKFGRSYTLKKKK